MKIICSWNSLKPFWLYKFFSKHVSMWCQKKYLGCNISWCPRTAFLKHFKSKFLYIYVYLLKKNVSGEGWDRGWLIRFTIVLQFFILIEIFENSTIFSISILQFIALKRWNFPGNLDFKGKIGATFLIRSHYLSI